MKRIYHHHKDWEEVAYNMYGNVSSTNLRQELVNDVVRYFNSPKLVRSYMAWVIDKFKCSCEHNLTNPSMNHIAWLGQASVAAWNSIPKEVTIEGWHLLDKETQERANKIAAEEIERWKQCQNTI